MKLTDKKTERFELRVTKKELFLIRVGGSMVGRTPTKFVRMVLENALVQIEKNLKDEGFDFENIERDFNDQL